MARENERMGPGLNFSPGLTFIGNRPKGFFLSAEGADPLTAGEAHRALQGPVLLQGRAIKKYRRPSPGRMPGKARRKICSFSCP